LSVVVDVKPSKGPSILNIPGNLGIVDRNPMLPGCRCKPQRSTFELIRLHFNTLRITQIPRTTSNSLNTDSLESWPLPLLPTSISIYTHLYRRDYCQCQDFVRFISLFTGPEQPWVCARAGTD